MLLQERTGICGEERAPLCGRAATMERSAQQQGRFRSRLGSKALAVRVGVVALALVAAGCTNSSPTATGTTPVSGGTATRAELRRTRPTTCRSFGGLSGRLTPATCLRRLDLPKRLPAGHHTTHRQGDSISFSMRRLSGIAEVLLVTVASQALVQARRRRASGWVIGCGRRSVVPPADFRTGNDTGCPAARKSPITVLKQEFLRNVVTS